MSNDDQEVKLTLKVWADADVVRAADKEEENN
jgi:hypothetical protein